jgi:hypothetical protein
VPSPNDPDRRRKAIEAGLVSCLPLIYVHHVPKVTAAEYLSRSVAAAMGASSAGTVFARAKATR